MTTPIRLALITIVSISIIVLGYVALPKIWKSLSERATEKTQEIDIKQKEACIDVVMEILTTAPAYLEETEGLNDAVVKNGGTSIGITLEGSPNPKVDDAWGFSNTYDFSLHETYSDRMLTIARFVFNPSDRQLYKFDDLEDELIPIEFNRNLLSKFNEACK